MNAFLHGFGREAHKLEQPQQPVVLILGAPRSGTTLIYQFLASTGVFAYPTNLMARFYGSGHFAACVQEVFAKEVLDRRTSSDETDLAISLESTYGKTAGLFQPSEFWYFWRRFFPLDVPKPLSECSQTVNSKEFFEELADIQAILGKPLLMKGMLLCFDLNVFTDALKQVIFVSVQRDIEYNAQSLIIARQNLLRDTSEWYSTQPPEHEWLRSATVEEQVVGQVYFTNKAIAEQLAQLENVHTVAVRYEDFCRQPKSLLDALNSSFESMGHHLGAACESTVSLDSTNRVSVTDRQFDVLRRLSLEIVENPEAFKARCIGQ